MEESNQVEPKSEAEEYPPEQYRDPQIDELIAVLQNISYHLSDLLPINQSLHGISEALYTNEFLMPEILSEKISASEGSFIFGRRVTRFELLTKAIERLRPWPWYTRVAHWFGVKRANKKLREMTEAQKEQAKKRSEHMQYLAENAGKLNFGRFRSRY